MSAHVFDYRPDPDWIDRQITTELAVDFAAAGRDPWAHTPTHLAPTTDSTP